MVRITENLIRKRAEHNECIISTLEEISLHQQDIERIEYIDKWCRDLKILYLQSNLIPKIENVGRLKKLEYLNLALNNIEKVENLAGCESLKKLDFTVNFIGDLLSIESLKNLYNLQELYLTGNPCTEYDGYRQYVVAVLPQLRFLDGVEIEKSERIKASQVLHEIRPWILQQQEKYKKKRPVSLWETPQETTNYDQMKNLAWMTNQTANQDMEKQKEDELKPEDQKSGECLGSDSSWYTDINTDRHETGDAKMEKTLDFHGKPRTQEEILAEEQRKEKEFWDEKVAYTPESRIKIHQHLQEKKNRENQKSRPGPDVPERERRLQMEDGRMLNVNEAKVDFSINEDDDSIVLDVAVYRYLDTSLCDVDVQTTYVRVTIKGKVLQLVLPEEVKPDSASAQRSQTTGHLLISMPKAHPVIQGQKSVQNCASSQSRKSTETEAHQKESHKTESTKHETLEVDPTSCKTVDFGNIVSSSENSMAPFGPTKAVRSTQERPNSEEFVDDLDVPPLI